MKKVICFIGALLIVIGTIGATSTAEAATQRSYQYDNSGRLQSITLPNYKITFTYDKNGNLLKRSVTSTAPTLK